MFPPTSPVFIQVAPWLPSSCAMRNVDNSNKGRKNSYGTTVEYDREHWKVAGWNMSAAVLMQFWFEAPVQINIINDIYIYICTYCICIIYSISWFKVDLKDVLKLAASKFRPANVNFLPSASSPNGPRDMHRKWIESTLHHWRFRAWGLPQS